MLVPAEQGRRENIMAIQSSETELSEERKGSLERYHEDALWFGAHVQELFEQYPDHWVGIHQEQVVGASRDLDELMRNLKANGFPSGIVFMDFLNSDPTPWVLASAG